MDEDQEARVSEMNLWDQQHDLRPACSTHNLRVAAPPTGRRVDPERLEEALIFTRNCSGDRGKGRFGAKMVEWAP